MNVIKYNVNSGDVCQIGRQYEYGKTQVIFEGYQVTDSANEIYFKFVGRTEESKYLIPIVDMTLDITQQLTKHVGQFSCQLEEMNTEGTLVSQSPVFYVAVKRSIKVGADYEVQDPRLETIYQKYNEMYNIISQTNETSLANESQRQAEWLTLKQEVSDAINSFDAETAISEFRNLVQTETDNFNINATEKLNAYNSNANNKVSEFNAQTEQIQTDISELKSNLNDLESCVYTEKEVSIPVANIAGITKKTGYNATIDPSNGINIQALSGYDTYYFVASEAMQIYVGETVPANKYYALSIGRNYTGINVHGDYYTLESESPIRYRNSENNLPTVDNKLTVNAGDVLVFTFTSGSVFSIIGAPVKILNFETAESGTYTKTANELQITTNKARYIFKHITNNSINVDTWRLYSGELKRINGTLFEMWSGSDAEGVVQISGEDDFIGGYHGDEIMTNIRIFADGVDITSESSKTDKFDVISIYVESDVYHCNTSDLASTIAFKRNKWLKFEGEKVRIGNEWTAQSDLVIASAPLAFFQCYYKENEVEVATDYMANSDYKLYQMSTPATHTPNSKDSTEFTLETKINPIRFKSIKTNGVNPVGVVAHNFISTQNRIKFYYYTIYNSTAITNGDKLISEFEFEIGR